MSDSNILSIRDIVKTYPGVVAIDHVSFDVREGEVHALIGENGAGKSTLIKVLSGAIQPDSGSITIGGKTFEAMTPILSKEQGIGVIYQEFTLVPGISAAENVFLGQKTSDGLFVNYEERIRRTKELFDQMHVNIDPTKERVTEDTQAAEESSGQVVNISFTEQLKACFSNRYWLFIMGFITVYEVTNSLSTQTILYFSNWVMNSSIDSGMGTQMLINAIGQAPLGLGVIFLWPLVKKFGKQRVMQVGCGIGVVGCALALGNVLFGTPNLGIVLVGVVVKSFGALPITYILVAMLADTLDHVEWANRFRADGFTASIRTIVFTVGAGIAQTIILGGISALGYIVPADTTQVVEQPLAIRTFFALCFLGAPLVCNVIGFIFMFFFDVEKKLPKIHEEVTARHKAEAEARGEVYVSPEEKAAQEQAENDRIAEENRIRELKARCRKKGLDFATEEAKYQKALADKKAKAAAKKK